MICYKRVGLYHRFFCFFLVFWLTYNKAGSNTEIDQVDRSYLGFCLKKIFRLSNTNHDRATLDNEPQSTSIFFIRPCDRLYSAYTEYQFFEIVTLLPFCGRYAKIWSRKHGFQFYKKNMTIFEVVTFKHYQR